MAEEMPRTYREIVEYMQADAAAFAAEVKDYQVVDGVARSETSGYAKGVGYYVLRSTHLYGGGRTLADRCFELQRGRMGTRSVMEASYHLNHGTAAIMAHQRNALEPTDIAITESGGIALVTHHTHGRGSNRKTITTTKLPPDLYLSEDGFKIHGARLIMAAWDQDVDAALLRILAKVSQ